jgi:hypothetical protein
MKLTARQRKALQDLGPPGHFSVDWRPRLSGNEYDDLKARGFIAEAWTWASRTRPDVSITDAGVAALADPHP